eukprot:1185434-Prorocentrum_minimum.AAC.2
MSPKCVVARHSRFAPSSLNRTHSTRSCPFGISYYQIWGRLTEVGPWHDTPNGMAREGSSGGDRLGEAEGGGDHSGGGENTGGDRREDRARGAQQGGGGRARPKDEAGQDGRHWHRVLAAPHQANLPLVREGRRLGRAGVLCEGPAGHERLRAVRAGVDRQGRGGDWEPPRLYRPLRRSRRRAGQTSPSCGVIHPSCGVTHPSSGVIHPSSGVIHPSSGVIHPSSGVILGAAEGVTAEGVTAGVAAPPVCGGAAEPRLPGGPGGTAGTEGDPRPHRGGVRGPSEGARRKVTIHSLTELFTFVHFFVDRLPTAIDQLRHRTSFVDLSVQCSEYSLRH